MLRIGITGPIGAGKSFVSQKLRNRGFMVLDADQTVHQLYRDEKKLREDLSRNFGEGVLTPEGVERKVLGGLVFINPEARERLEGLVYPYLEEKVKNFFDRAAMEGASAAFLEAALLSKVPSVLEILDEVWIVTAPAEVRLSRLVNERHLAVDDATCRINLQGNSVVNSSYCGKVTRVIENGGPSVPLDQNLDKILALFD